jgi:hypothetical protein
VRTTRYDVSMATRPPPDRVYLSREQNRRRDLLFRVGAGALLVLLVLSVGGWILSRSPTPGRVTVYDATSGKRLWSRTTPGGYLVVLAVTPAGVLVADADDCIHGGAGRVELLTPKRTTVVGATSGCAVYHFFSTNGVFARRTAGSNARVVVTVPSELLPLRSSLSMPCPCPASTPAPNGNAGSPVEFGATAKVQLGKFTLGSD